MPMRQAFRRLGRSSSKERQLLLMNLVTALIKYERIVTTVPRAKELRRVGDKVCLPCDVIMRLSDVYLQMITYGKRGNDHAIETLNRWMKVSE